jgi:hypothetical protein
MVENSIACPQKNTKTLLFHSTVVCVSMMCFPHSALGLPNPATTYCRDLGYTYETRDGPQGEYGVCVFPDDSECEAWNFYNGQCGQPFSFCEKTGGTLNIETNVLCPSDDECAICTTPSGTECTESSYFDGTCPTNSSVGDSSGCNLTKAALCHREASDHSTFIWFFFSMLGLITLRIRRL